MAGQAGDPDRVPALHVWIITSDALMAALDEAYGGTTPGFVYLALVRNGDVIPFEPDGD